MLNKSVENSQNWWHTLFVEHPHLYLQLLLAERANAKREVNKLCRILDGHGVSKGSSILDLSCGIGRHAINLWKTGYHVTGYDPSPLYIDIAQHEVKKHSSRTMLPKFYQGKPGDASTVLSNNMNAHFDAIISMWQSFGYGSVEDDIKIFSDVLNLATEHSLLIIESQNRDWTIRNFQQHVIYEFDNLAIFEHWKFNIEKSILENISKFYSRDVNNGNLHLLLCLPTTMKLYSLHELTDLLKKSGWQNIDSYDGLNLHKLVSIDSPRFVTVYRPLHGLSR